MSNSLPYKMTGDITDLLMTVRSEAETSLKEILCSRVLNGESVEGDPEIIRLAAEIKLINALDQRVRHLKTYWFNGTSDSEAGIRGGD